MELGKLCQYQHRDRPKDSPSHCCLQTWCAGKDRTRYIRPEELPAIQEANDGHQRFRELAEQYVGIVVAETRQRLDDPAKGKTLRYTPHSMTNFPGSSRPS